jgi:AcrR family transcriptional regulator
MNATSHGVNMTREREELLHTACARFRESGITGVPLSALAEAANMPEERAREIFPDRDDLLYAVYLLELERMGTHSFADLPEGPLGKKLRHLLGFRYDFFARHKRSSRKVMLEALLGNARWRDDYENLLWRFSVEIVALIQAAERSGEIRKDVDEGLTARAFVAYYVTGLLMLLRTEEAAADDACSFTFPLVDSLVSSLA